MKTAWWILGAFALVAIGLVLASIDQPTRGDRWQLYILAFYAVSAGITPLILVLIWRLILRMIGDVSAAARGDRS